MKGAMDEGEAEGDRAADIPAVTTGQPLAVLYPPIFTERGDTTWRVQLFAEQWARLLQRGGVLDDVELQLLKEQGMLVRADVAKPFWR